MRTLATISACALLAFAAPAFAQATSSSTLHHELKNNGSVDGPGYSHAAQPGDRDTESGKSPRMNEGRASAEMKVGAAQVGRRFAGANARRRHNGQIGSSRPSPRSGGPRPPRYVLGRRRPRGPTLPLGRRRRPGGRRCKSALHFEIFSSATPLTRGPNIPIVAITTAIAPAMNRNTPPTPKRLQEIGDDEGTENHRQPAPGIDKTRRPRPQPVGNSSC